jgi:zinc transporter ZupT
MNALTGWKLAALAALLVLALLGGAVPLLWKRLRDSPVALSHLNTFSGGVFFAMALGHLLPDAVEAFEKLNISFRATPYTIALGGYLFILFVEKIIVDAHAFAHGHDDDGHSRTPSIHEPAAQSPIESACVRVPNITLPPPPKLVLGAHSDHLVNAAQPSEHVSRLIAPDSPLAESHPAARRRFLAQAALLPPEEVCWSTNS